jgi:ketosteroid isomerase-like protein
MPEESTTPDRVERTRLAFAAWNRGDLDETLKDFAPDAVWEAVPLGLTFDGIAAIRSFLEDWRSTYDEYEIQPHEIRDVSNDVVLTVVRQMVLPAGSTGPTRIAEDWAFVFAWRGGRVVRAVAQQNIDEARAAAQRLAEARG